MNGIDKQVNLALINEIMSDNILQIEKNDRVILDDIISWINENLEELLNKSVTEIDVVRGDALCNFLRKAQTEYDKYLECSIPNEKSVILVALTKEGKMVSDYTICYEGNLPLCLEMLFKEQPTLKIKLDSRI